MVTQVSKVQASTCCSPLQGAMSPELFRALADPTRVAILCELAQCSGSRRVTEVAGCCTVDLSVVSRHLKILRSAGIVEATKEGREVFYQVRHGVLASAMRSIADALDVCCPPEASRLEQSNVAKTPKE